MSEEERMEGVSPHPEVDRIANNSEQIGQLRQTTADLVNEVGILSRNLEVTDKVVKRGKRNQGLIAVLGCIAIILGISVFVQQRAIHDSQVRNCQNANESRKGTLLLWNTILNAPRPAGSPPRTSEQEKQTADFQIFLNQLYVPRDCSDLTKEYELPPIPDSLQPKD